MKTIVITGAAGFLGTATTKLFLERGYRVKAIVHNERAAETLETHPELQTIVGDLNDTARVEAIINGIIGEKERLYGCLLLAGGYSGNGINDTPIDDIRQQIALNFETGYNVVKALYPYLKRGGEGRIVLVGAQPPLMAKKAVRAVAYSLSKSLLFQLAEILNEDAKGTDVVTHVVVPSIIDTPANRNSMPDADYSKWVKPEQLAETMEIICSDASAAWRQPVIKVYNNVV